MFTGASFPQENYTAAMSTADTRQPPEPTDRPSHRVATVADEGYLLALMRAFYAEETLVFEESVAQRAVHDLLTHPQLGLIIVLEIADRPIGYLTLTVGFSLEFHGRYALVDELYLIPSVRGRGWGRHCLELAASLAREMGTNALRLEVNHANTRARTLYLRNSFRDDRRDLFTRWL